MPTPFSSHSHRAHVLAIVLAGGEGRRLWPLTADRAKPAVPMAGRYRLIDFVLSNFVNSGLLQIKVLTQYKSDSLNTHIARGWRLPAFLDLYVEVVPAQQRTGGSWFKGSADAIHQSLNVITDEDPDHVAVFGGDHMYKMDVRQMVDAHIESRADATVAAIPVPVAEATAFGVIEVDDRGKVITFDEKPQHPREIPGRPGWALASMGNYVFRTGALVEELARDASGNSAHDFGRNILPEMVARGRDVYVYDFSQNEIPGSHPNERGYWRDVGTIGAYWQANMDLTQVVPDFDLYNPRWPLRTWTRPLPPAKFVFADPGDGSGHSRMGIATDSLVSEGCIISGGRIDRTVLSPQVRINSFAYVEESLILDNVEIGRYCRIRKAIIDKGVHVPPHTEIGYDPEADARRFTISDGVVVVPKGYKFE
ncbi:MAG TPA: glucose-1-phosphate adenylyltransferase [Polyangia bacterium]|jgi:glucose-1-phosphate adenylyltransferase|nr:glucose-1-phosphate adenylyltransferase [Polyangia bacterium]